MPSGARIYFTKHAEQRFVERNFPLPEVERMLAKGVTVRHPDNCRKKLCVGKDSKGEFFTIVFKEVADGLLILTGFKSPAWMVGLFERAKRRT